MPIKKKNPLVENSPVESVIANQPATAEPAGSTPKIKGLLASKKKLLALGAGLIALLIIYGSAYTYNQNAKKQEQLKATLAKPQDEVSQVVSELGKLVILPKDEQPVVATVVDLDKLKGQAFFTKAQLQDKVIIYSKAGRAILYRPSSNKIVEIAPFTNTAQSNSSGNVLGANTADAQGQTVNVEIRNGSGKSGQATIIKTKISEIKNVKVTTVGNAATTYPSTQIVLLKNISSELLSQIQKIIPGQTTTSLPSGESTSNADVVIILGQ